MVASLAAVGPRYTDLSTMVSPSAVDSYRGQPTPQMIAALDAIGWSASAWAVYMTTLETLLSFSAISVAFFILIKSQNNWFAVWMAVGLATGNTGAVFTLQVLQESQPVWMVPVQLLQVLGFVGYASTLVLFPNGRFIPAWTRRLSIFWVAYVLVSVFVIPEWQVAGTIDAIDTPNEAFKGLVVTGFLLSGIGFQVYRYFWHSSQLERQQAKWVVFGLSCFIVAIIPLPIAAFISPDLVLGPFDTSGGLVFQIVYLTIIHVIGMLIPVAIAFAILRYRLWDIDIIINRTLVYSILSALIFGLYFIIVSGLSLVVATSGAQILSLLAIVVLVMSFHRLYGRVQRGVNRLMFGQRNEPQTVLANLTQQLQTATLPEDLLQVSTETIGKSLRVPYVAVAIRHGEDIEKRAEYGRNGLPTQAFPLVHQNEAVGELIVGQRSPNESLNAADLSVLSSVALQLGAVVYAVRLHAELQTARERLVIAREEERQRIRRDLHDGLGPALASQPLKFDIAIENICDNPTVAIAVLEDMKRNTQGFVGEIRRIIQDLRPPALDELGLVGSLRGAISSVVPHSNTLDISLTAEIRSPRVSAATEAAAYRIVMEAVTNVIKHAQARHCWIHLDTPGNTPWLRISVDDDGVGIPQPVTPNVGLTSMRERAEELGGTITIQPRSSGGTQVSVSLPILSRE
jgi:signal transduction histidine kinase